MMVHLRKMVVGNDYRYRAVPEPDSPVRERRRTPFAQRRKTLVLTVAVVFIIALLFIPNYRWGAGSGNRCEEQGNCVDTSSHSWGQYSPFFSVPSDIESAIPAGCDVTFASVLSRHGARDPTARKTVLYSDLVDRIQNTVSEYGLGAEFLKKYEYTLGSDQLTFFGEQQMVDLGKAFGNRYRTLVDKDDPFTRAAGSDRVTASAENFTHGLYAILEREGTEQVDNILVIPETDGFNNSLNHGACQEFEDGPSSELGREKQNIWRDIWVPPVRDRLNKKLPGADLSLEETIYMMDLCPFNTVADPHAEKSAFCSLFSKEEWQNYDYFESLEKWYSYGSGNPLGSTQGIGYVNELIARLTGEPVEDNTTTNSTLDSSPKTFPLNRNVYADFSHDNTMSSIYGALGLYNGTEDLPVKHKLPPQKAGGYSAAWTVPFGGRMYVEKMRCGGGDADAEKEELVRVLVNDRVVPLQACKADNLGRCKLSAFIESLSFARDGGLWHECLK